MSEEWKVQWSFKTPTGDLVNVRAQTPEELSVLLEGIADVAGQASATSSMIGAAFNAAPLATTTTTPVSTPVQSSAPTQVQGLSAGTPTCVHGPRKFMSGISKKNGKPYSMYVCTQPQGDNQCSPVNQ